MAKPRRPAAQLRKAGTIVLVVGVILAGLVYAGGTFVSVKAADDSLSGGNEKVQTREIQQLWGTGGSVMMDLTAAVQRPAFLSGIVAGISVLIALACYFFASRIEAEDRAKKPPL